MEDIIKAAIACAEHEYQKNIQDTQADYPGDIQEIARIIRSSGGVWERKIMKGGYKEKNFQWCGFWVAHLFRSVGNFIRKDRCVAITLHPKIAEFVMPSTYRLNSSAKWLQAGFKPLSGTKFLKSPQAGDVATVGKKKKYGDHVIFIESVDGEYIYTIEGNAYGKIYDGRWREGVVKRKRHMNELRRVYRLEEKHFLKL